MEEVIFANIGIFGIIIPSLPGETWKTVAPYGLYHPGDNRDFKLAKKMRCRNVSKSDITGWFYEPYALQILLDTGYKVHYRGHEIFNMEDIPVVDEKLDEKQQQLNSAWEILN